MRLESIACRRSKRGRHRSDAQHLYLKFALFICAAFGKWDSRLETKIWVCSSSVPMEMCSTGWTLKTKRFRCKFTLPLEISLSEHHSVKTSLLFPRCHVPRRLGRGAINNIKTRNKVLIFWVNPKQLKIFEVKFSLRKIRRIFPIKLRNFKLWKCLNY